MKVCLWYEEGWFLRINTSDAFRPCVAIEKSYNPFLKHDSHVECALLIVDEYEIEQTLLERGVVGRLSLRHKDDILERLLGATYINEKNKAELKRIFSENN